MKRFVSTVILLAILIMLGCGSKEKAETAGQSDGVAGNKPATADSSASKPAPPVEPLAKSVATPEPTSKGQSNTPTAPIKKPKDRNEAEQMAIVLLGRSRDVNMSVKQGMHTITGMQAAEQSLPKITKTLDSPDGFGKTFRAAAAELTACEDGVQLLVKASICPKLAEIKALLGKEDSTSQGSLVIRDGKPDIEEKVTWYRFGWLEFAVAEETVYAVRGDSPTADSSASNSATPVESPATLKPSTQSMQTWTDTTGKFKIEAAFVEFKDGKVRLRKKDGSWTTIAIEKLSEADQEYVKKRDQPKPEAAETAVAEPQLVSDIAVGYAIANYANRTILIGSIQGIVLKKMLVADMDTKAIIACLQEGKLIGFSERRVEHKVGGRTAVSKYFLPGVKGEDGREYTVYLHSSRLAIMAIAVKGANNKEHLLFVDSSRVE